LPAERIRLQIFFFNAFNTNAIASSFALIFPSKLRVFHDFTDIAEDGLEQRQRGKVLPAEEVAGECPQKYS